MIVALYSVSAEGVRFTQSCFCHMGRRWMWSDTCRPMCYL